MTSFYKGRRRGGGSKWRVGTSHDIHNNNSRQQTRVKYSIQTKKISSSSKSNTLSDQVNASLLKALLRLKMTCLKGDIEGSHRLASFVPLSKARADWSFANFRSHTARQELILPEGTSQGQNTSTDRPMGEQVAWEGEGVRVGRGGIEYGWEKMQGQGRKRRGGENREDKQGGGGKEKE